MNRELKYRDGRKCKIRVSNHERVPRQGRVKLVEEIRETHLSHHQIIAIAINNRPIEVENYRNPSHLGHCKKSSNLYRMRSDPRGQEAVSTVNSAAGDATPRRPINRKNKP